MSACDPERRAAFEKEFRGTLRRMAGRNPDVGESRDQYLRVRVAPFEMDKVDRARDGLSRSDYVRRLIEDDVARKGIS